MLSLGRKMSLLKPVLVFNLSKTIIIESFEFTSFLLVDSLWNKYLGIQ